VPDDHVDRDAQAKSGGYRGRAGRNSPQNSSWPPRSTTASSLCEPWDVTARFPWEESP